MSEINNYDPNNYDPNPYDDVTIDEALAQIYDRVNDRTIRQIVTILKKVIDGISTGDISRYTVEKTTAESGEVTYKLMQQINNGIPTPVGDTVSLRGSQILANYDEELQILDNIINIIKVALDSKADATDIPTVPITSIQKNGTTIMPVDGTVNITVPVVATDVAALPDTTKYAAALSLTIDSATFIVTGQLKDQNGNNLGAAQTIDLPLESVVVGGSYNSQTQKVVLTLQNGNTIEFSVADLVYGLQTELSETNKLNPAYINYDSTHRAVSDTEKSEWNGKQDVIDSSHKLSADFVDDTNAANKFATEEELEQIETNKNNISLQQDTTAQSGNGYAIINGKRLYMTDTEPTNQRIGDVWIYDRLYSYTPILANSPLYGTEAYKDSIDLSTGTITRKIRKLTLDSSINLGSPTAITGGYRYSVSNAMTDPALSDSAKWKCSHLAYRSDWGLLGFTVSNSANTLFIMINIDTTDGLKAWLDAQIAANTPVILYYSSSSDTTETVTIPTGLTGTATGTMEQSGTPQPDNPIYPTGNNVTIWH